MVTGDVTQVDLPGGTSSGLRVVRDILDDVDDVHFAQLVQRRRGPAQAGRPRSSTRTRSGTPSRSRQAQTSRRDRVAPHQARPTPASAAEASAKRISVHRDQPTSPASRSTPTRCSTSPATPSTRWGSTRSPSCRCCWSTSTYMTELNHRWMGGDGPTDVLAFPMDEGSVDHGRGEVRPGRGEPALLGDIVLCPEVAAKQADAAGHAHRRRAAPAHRARRAAPARLRPRRAGRGARDVRAAEPAAGTAGGRTGTAERHRGPPDDLASGGPGGGRRSMRRRGTPRGRAAHDGDRAAGRGGSGGAGRRCSR